MAQPSLAELVAVSEKVASTRSRKQKTRSIADYLVTLPPERRDVAVSFLIGRPLQSKLGAGFAAAYRTEAEPAAEATLTLEDVDYTLAAMAEMSGEGSQTERLATLERLLGRATAAEQSFLKRLIVRDLRQGATDGVMIDAIGIAAGVDVGVVRRAAMLRGDLVETASIALEGGAEALKAVHLQLLRPVAPMLASTAASMDDAMGDDLRLVETKLDGARIQLHVADGEVAVFTRNLNDITHRLPTIVEEAKAFPHDSLLLDGEVLVVARDGSPVLFQDSMQQFGADEVPAAGEGQAIRAFYFDLLHMDGVDLIDQPLLERRAALERLPGDVVVPQIATADADAAGRFMDEVLAAGHEGVMVKDPESLYEAGRRGSAWRKVKPVYTFDLVVLAVEWGSGRRRGWLSNIHLGARTDDGFAMVGKTFKGMTDAMLDWQTARFLELETHREGHVVSVRPEQVVEVAIDGVQRSPRYDGGIALRFARVKRYRDDKAPAEADSLESLRAMLPKR